MWKLLRETIWGICCTESNTHLNWYSPQFWDILNNKIRNQKIALRLLGKSRIKELTIKLKELKNCTELIQKARLTELYRQRFPKYIVALDSQEKNKLEIFCRDIGEKNNWDILGRIGEGTYSKIYLILDKKQKEFLCLKTMDLNELNIKGPGYDEKQREIELKAGKISNDKTITIDRFYNRNMYVLVMKYFPSISIYDTWQKLCNINLKDKIILLKNILDGIEAIHLSGLIHRNINPKNILIDILETQNIKIIDFSSCIKSEDVKTANDLKVGDPSILDPEGVFEILPENYDPYTIDIWAYGVFAYKLLNNIGNPFCDVAADQHPDKFPESLGELLGGKLAEAILSDSLKRPKIKEIFYAIRIFLHQYMYIESNRLHEQLEQLIQIDNKSPRTCIVVETENDTARIYLDDSSLVEVEYGELRGLEALKDILDDSKILHNIKIEINLKSLPEKNIEFSKYDNSKEYLIFDLVSQKDTLNKYRKLIRQSIEEIIGVKNNKVICKKCSQAYPLNELFCSINLFLYGTDHKKLAPYCINCINKISIKKHRGSLKQIPGYDIIVPCYKRLHAEYYLAFQKADYAIYAKKLIYYNKLGLRPGEWNMLLNRSLRGYAILSKYPSRYFTTVKKYEGVTLFEDYFPGISLRQFLTNFNIFEIEFEVKTTILYELAKALQIMHSNYLIHRNINPATIMIGLNGQIKLSDFSLFRYNDEGYEPAYNLDNEDFYFKTIQLNTEHPAGVIAYISSEQRYNMSEAGSESDIWSWGIIAYEVLTGKHPFKDKQGSYNYLIDPDYSIITEKYRNLIKQALARKPEQRCTSEDIVRVFEKIMFLSDIA